MYVRFWPIAITPEVGPRPRRTLLDEHTKLARLHDFCYEVLDSRHERFRGLASRFRRVAAFKLVVLLYHLGNPSESPNATSRQEIPHPLHAIPEVRSSLARLPAVRRDLGLHDRGAAGCV